MSRYFFDLIDNGRRSVDAFGEELPNVYEASEHAQAILAHVLRERLPNGDHSTCACDVRNADGSIVYQGSVTFHGQFTTEFDVATSAAM